MLYAFVIPFIVEAVTRKALIRLRLWGQPTVILGANETAENLVKLMQARPELGHIPVGLFDDNAAPWGTTVDGIEVLGPRAHAGAPDHTRIRTRIHALIGSETRQARVHKHGEIQV